MLCMFHPVIATIAFKISLFGFKSYETFINKKKMKLVFHHTMLISQKLLEIDTKISLSRTYFSRYRELFSSFVAFELTGTAI